MTLATTLSTAVQQPQELVTLIDASQHEAAPLIPDYLQTPSRAKRVVQAAASGILNAGLSLGIVHLLRLGLSPDIAFTPGQAAVYYGTSAAFGLASGLFIDLRLSPPGFPWNGWNWKEHVVKTVTGCMLPWFLISWVGAVGDDGQRHKSNPAEMVQWAGPVMSGMMAFMSSALSFCCRRDQVDSTS